MELIESIHELIIGILPDPEYWSLAIPFFMLVVLLTTFAIVVYLAPSDLFYENKTVANKKNKRASSSARNNKTAKSNTTYNIKKTEVNNVTNIEVNNITYVEVKTGQDDHKE